jgi:hypothetical protein
VVLAQQERDLWHQLEVVVGNIGTHGAVLEGLANHERAVIEDATVTLR